MSIQFNRVAAEPSLRDLLDLHKKDLMLSLNCHAIATVQSFNEANQTITATINYKKTYFQLNKKTNVYVPFNLDYPLIIDCPVVILGGGPCSLTFPIAAGDECLILFNDRDIDNWFQGGPPMEVASGRLHSFSDGIALVGLRNSQRSLQAYDTTRVVLQNGTTKVGVGATKVIISNGTTLNTLLGNLISTIQSLITTPAVPGVPCTLDPSTIAALSIDAANLGALSE